MTREAFSDGDRLVGEVHDGLRGSPGLGATDRPMSDGSGAIFSITVVLMVIVIVNWWLWTQ
jgi:hypothetical protein